ncbi:sulfite exporter TauE/SafE family protein [Thiomicrorhabdus sediminis]|uniref:Sulfite exporter TauE/SafE family protein n=1 Tax=Thiomicrorhabdus sediminis TaxID=2580412 RepID=A0A4P9K3A5_9GAMM|nr:sulfite exporter TauE/SafE family protein [Thiomicrorhabdus sediminis]QCU89329.1 sulfite exporter TauE/SafE family protein [Thiomicrorhabdus sediminis]
MESIYITALLVGLLGGVHCLGMCGGIVGGLTFSVDAKVQLSWWRMFSYQLFYNLGRISSYMVVGAIFGALGMVLVSIQSVVPFQQILQLIAGLFMIALGLYLGGWWFLINRVEAVGQLIWQRLAPFAERFAQVRNYRQAWLYGLLWGWLPCGLVYSMLIMAMTAGGAIEGAALMLAFGLGTLPNLLLMGSFAFYFTRWSRNPKVKSVAGSSVVILGCWQIYLAVNLTA